MSDEDDPNPRPTKRSKNNPFSLNAYEIAEAEEVGGNDDDFYDDDIGERDFDEQQAVEIQEKYDQNRTKHMEMYQKQQLNDVQGQIDFLEQKYGGGNWGDDVGVDEAAERQSVVSGYADLDTSALLPTVRDPKLFLVPVIGGKERIIVKQLMEKFLRYRNHPVKKLYIKSVFTTDQSTGHIYVEADKEVHVRRACEGVRGLNAWKVRLVPINEMSSALAVKNSSARVKKGQWVRMTRGLYKDDLCKVYRTLDQGSKLCVKLIPRIDFRRIAGGGRSFQRRRPNQRLFSKTDIQQMGGEVTREEDRMVLNRHCDVYKGQKYMKGFLYKIVAVEHVRTEISATTEELRKFKQKVLADEDDSESSDDGDDMVANNLKVVHSVGEFQRGDNVRVISGALRNLTGTVLTSSKNADKRVIVTLMPDHEALDEPLDFPADELKKFFLVGGHIKVLKGEYKEETGLIVRVIEDTNELIIFSDLRNVEFTTKADDVIETTEVSGGRDAMGNYELHDLVVLNTDTVGVIVQIQTGELTVLDNKGMLQSVRLTDILKQAQDRYATALDMDGNPVVLEDIVIPQIGPYAQKRGTVSHIFRTTLFLHRRDESQNSGIYVVKSKICRVAGKRFSRNNPTTEKYVGAKSVYRNRRRMDSDPWYQKTVRILKGVWKGYKGIVSGVTDTKLQVELHAQNKKITLTRDKVKEIAKHRQTKAHEGRTRRGELGGMTPAMGGMSPYPGGSMTPSHLIGAATPRHSDEQGSQTPWLSGTTPRHGAATPHWDGATPRYGDGSRTPNHGGMTPRADGGATPHYGGQTPHYGGQTPHYGGQTPHYGGQTPHYGGTTPRADGTTPRYGGETPAYGGQTPHYGGQTPHYGGTTPAMTPNVRTPRVGAGGTPDSARSGGQVWSPASGGGGTPKTPSVNDSTPGLSPASSNMGTSPQVGGSTPSSSFNPAFAPATTTGGESPAIGSGASPMHSVGSSTSQQVGSQDVTSAMSEMGSASGYSPLHSSSMQSGPGSQLSGVGSGLGSGSDIGSAGVGSTSDIGSDGVGSGVHYSSTMDSGGISATGGSGSEPMAPDFAPGSSSEGPPTYKMNRYNDDFDPSDMSGAEQPFSPDEGNFHSSSYHSKTETGMSGSDSEALGSSAAYISGSDTQGGIQSGSGAGSQGNFSDTASASESDIGAGDEPQDPFFFVVPNAVCQHSTNGNGEVVVKRIVDDTQVVIQDMDGNEEQTINKDELEHMLAREDDPVKILAGGHAGEKGEIIGIDGQDAIVKMDVTYEIQIIPHNLMVRLAEK